ERPSKRALTREEADVEVGKYLQLRPNATVRRLAEAIGVATGTICKLPAWRNAMAKRQAARRTSVKTVSTKDGSLDWLGANDPDPEAYIDAEDTAFHRLAAEMPPELRRRLMALKSSQQSALVQYVVAEKPEGNVELIQAIVEQWFDQEEDRKRRSR